MKKIILALAIATAAVEHSFALLPPVLKYIARGPIMQEKLEMLRNSAQNENKPQVQTPIEMPQATCELLISFCADLFDPETIITKDSTQYSQFLAVRTWAIKNGALRDCIQKPELMNRVRKALALEKDVPHTALANEMFRELVRDVALQELRDDVEQDAIQREKAQSSAS